MEQLTQLNGAALAYIGDAIYEVKVREAVILAGVTQPNRLHRAATRYVAAGAQAYIVQHLRDEGILTDAELTIYKRGRNHKANTKAKNASIGDYRQATGFEALIGWLYLTDQIDRLDEIVTLSLQFINERSVQNAKENV